MGMLGVVDWLLCGGGVSGNWGGSHGDESQLIVLNGSRLCISKNSGERVVVKGVFEVCVECGVA